MATTTLAQVTGRAGELVLREADGHLELICNGVFLMDTRDGRSERLLVGAAVDAATRPVRRVLLGGLGMGFSLAEARTVPTVEDIVVVELEAAVVDWNRSHAAARTGGSIDAAGVACVVADLVDWLRTDSTATPFDVVCLDVDNGPDWLVTPTNAWLYSERGVSALHDRLAPGGVLAVWCAAPSPVLQARLGARFGHVHHLDVEVARGTPDRVLVARR